MGKSIAGQLVLASIGLVVVTTLAVAVPAYWIIRTQLETQAGDQLQAARQATLSLYAAAGDRIQSMATLFAARPTLLTLVQAPASQTLLPYIERYSKQSQLDLLLLCDLNLRPIAGIPTAEPCLVQREPAITIFGGRPMLLASGQVSDLGGQVVAVTTIGVALDADYLAGLARATNSEQSLRTVDGERLVTTLAGSPQQTSFQSTPATQPSAEPFALQTGDKSYGALFSPLPAAGNAPALYAEIALPTDSLRATERSMLTMFVASTVLVALLGGLFSIWLIRRLTAPLAELTAVAERISEGDFTAGIPAFTTPEEVATLASGLQRSQRAMLQALDERAHAQEFRNDFLDNVTHELRTPLSTLNASLELLLDPELTVSAEEVRAILQPAHLSMFTLQQLIDNLLESGSIQAGRFVIHPQATDIHAVIGAALRLTQPILERRGQPVTLVNVARQPPVLADPARLVQVLVNLLTNASKYSPLAAPIEIHVQTADPWLWIAVADRGPGLPPGAVEKLFERYVRGEDRRGEGMGLGLFIAKTIVQAHGGTVGAENRPSGGASFWFTLPIATPVAVSGAQ